MLTPAALRACCRRVGRSAAAEWGRTAARGQQHSPVVLDADEKGLPAADLRCVRLPDVAVAAVGRVLGEEQRACGKEEEHGAGNEEGKPPGGEAGDAAVLDAGVDEGHDELRDAACVHVCVRGGAFGV